ncbi:hypothetical protein J2X02_000796 [Pseudoxanthomonas japonensis]|uniref:hypothetical protein n=1 Tax=Pseudoxanthomonas japonensis TaxID=69284 RepID=UPI00285E2E17|nr:hypothetical protein [Pseudoxanthomonas japonensis]MDR7067979.1 hypothetical protein [Pseudoxanthomonas japonensis]
MDVIAHRSWQARWPVLRLLAEHPLLIAVLAVAGFLLFRNGFAFGPNIFGDELSYSVLARASGHMSELDVPLVGPLPNHLYFDVYEGVASLGWAGLSAARSINAVFAAMAVVPLYLLVRRTQSPVTSAFIAAAAAIACPGLYASLYMPEAMYVFFFYTAFALSVSALDSRWEPGLVTAALCLCLAGMALTKPHGLVVAALICSSSCFSWTRGRWGENIRITLTALTVLGLSIAIRQVYVSFSGDAGGAVGDSMGGYRVLADFLPRMLESPKVLEDLRQVSLLNLASALPFVAPAVFFLLVGRSAHGNGNVRPLLMGLLLWLGLLAMVIGFTVLVSVGSGENLGRIHQRYYDHALVLLCVLSACSLPQVAGPRRLVAWTVWVAMLMAALYFRTRFPMSSTNWVDHPLMFGAYHFPVIGSLSLAIPFLAVVFAVRWPERQGLRALLILLLPTAASLLAMTAQLRESRMMTAADRIGLAFSLVSEPSERVHVVSAGGNDSVHRMAFYLGERADYAFFDPADPAPLAAYLSRLPEQARLLADERLPLGDAWVRTLRLQGGVSEYERRAEVEEQLSIGADGVELTLSQALPEGSAGFHGPEPWGAWMSAREAQIPLPKVITGHVVLSVTARRLSSGLTGPAAIVVCGKTIAFDPSDTMTETDLQVECDTPTDTRAAMLTVVSPYLRSPQSIGIGEDSRPLGLAISKIAVSSKRSP